MKDTLEYIIKAIVEEPEGVHVEENETEDGIVTLTVTVAQNDMGRIIGKEGKVIRSIRNVMKVKAMKENKKVTLSLTDSSTE